MLPVKIDERDVYFEVSAVIIAFVLLGKYMEEIIKKHSSAAVRKLLDLKPATAHVMRGGEEAEIPAEQDSCLGCHGSDPSMSMDRPHILRHPDTGQFVCWLKVMSPHGQRWRRPAI